MWHEEIVEGNDCPKTVDGKWDFLLCKFEEAGGTITSVLMLCTTKPINRKGKFVTIDSGFYIAAGIIKMHKSGVFGQVLIKKCGQYSPCHIPGNEIDNYFLDKDLGSTMSHWQEIDSINFFNSLHKRCKIHNKSD